MATAPAAVSADRAARLALPKKAPGHSAPSTTKRERDEMEEAMRLSCKGTQQHVLDSSTSPPAAQAAKDGQRSQKATPAGSQKSAPAQGNAPAPHDAAAAAMAVNDSDEDLAGQEAHAKRRRTQAVLDSKDGDDGKEGGSSSSSDSLTVDQDSESDFGGGASSSDDGDTSLEGSDLEDEEDHEPTPKKAKKGPAKPAGKAVPQRASAPASSKGASAKAKAGAKQALPAAPAAHAAPVAAKPVRKAPTAKGPLQSSVANSKQRKADPGSKAVAMMPAALVKRASCTPGTVGGVGKGAAAASTLQASSSIAPNAARLEEEGGLTATAPAGATPAATCKAGRSTAKLASDATHTPVCAVSAASGANLSSVAPCTTPGPGSLSRVLAKGPMYRVSGLTRRAALKPLHNVVRK